MQFITSTVPFSLIEERAHMILNALAAVQYDNIEKAYITVHETQATMTLNAYDDYQKDTEGSNRVDSFYWSTIILSSADEVQRVISELKTREQRELRFMTRKLTEAMAPTGTLQTAAGLSFAADLRAASESRFNLLESLMRGDSVPQDLDDEIPF